jgi:hypothetical protein
MYGAIPMLFNFIIQQASGNRGARHIQRGGVVANE